MLPFKILWVAANLFSVALTEYPFDGRYFEENTGIFKNNKTDVQLSNQAQPEIYDILLVTERVSEGDFSYRGVVKIAITVNESTCEIVLYKSHRTSVLDVNLTRINVSTPISVPLLPYHYDTATEILTIPTNGTELTVGDHFILEIQFTSQLSSDLQVENTNKGLYRDSGRLQKRISPCFDESRFKANFTVRIVHGQQYHVISNDTSTRVENSDRTATTSFTTLPSYPTYLIVSDFNCQSKRDMQTSLIETTSFALRVGEYLLTALSKFWQVDYTFSKINQIVLPEFGSEAIANLGLVTHGVDVLLWNKTINNFKQQIDLVIFISHKFTHQWFGNLVTLRWWNCAWLDAGLTSFFEHIGTALVYPEWDTIHYFLAKTCHNILQIDVRNAIQTLSFSDGLSTEISTIDSISNARSDCILNMFLHAFSKKNINYQPNESPLQSSVEDYKRSSFNEAAAQSSDMQNLNISEILTPWINQPGFPLIVVSRNYKKGLITLRQERYFSSPNQSNNTVSWWIPYNYATAQYPDFNNTLPNGWLRPNEPEKVFHSQISKDDWIILNKQQTGCYRVLYDELNYKLISKQLNSENFTAIHVLNRAQLLNDLDEFESTRRIKFEQLIEHLSYLKRETEYGPWEAARKILLRLNNQFAGHEHIDKFRWFAVNLVQPVLDHVGFEESPGEPMATKNLRTIVADLACQFGSKSCLKLAHAKFVHALRTGVDLNWSSNLKSIVFKNGARWATPDEIGLLWQRLIISTNSDDRDLYASSISLTRHSHVLSKYLHKTLNDHWSDSGDESSWRRTLFQSVLQSGEYRLKLCFQLLKHYATDVHRLFQSTKHEFILNLSSLITTLSTQKEFENLLDHLYSAEFIDAATVLEARSKVRGHLVWSQKRKPNVDVWLASLPPTDESKPSGAIVMISSIFLFVPALVLVIV